MGVGGGTYMYVYRSFLVLKMIGFCAHREMSRGGVKFT